MSLTITIPGAVEATTGSTAPATLTVGVGVPGATGATGPAGQGVPVGGTAGQFLTKIDGTNYNTDWTTVNLAQYLTTANAAATYQTLAGMSSYLTTSSAASTYAPIAAGIPTSGTVGQVLTKNSGTNYDASWATLIPGDRYLTTSSTTLTVSNGAKTLTVGTGLSYSPQQDIVISYDATAHMHAVVTTYDSGTGVLVCDVQNHTGTGTYSVWTVNVGGTVPLQSVYWGEILGTLGDQSDLATALNDKLDSSTAASTYYLQTNPAGYITSSALTGYATESWVTSQGYLTSSSLTGYAQLSGATFTGEVATPASTTTTAGFSIAPGVAPTTPTNGDFWVTATGLFTQIGGATKTSAFLEGATFTGLISTPAATTSSAGLRVAHGTAPTTPTNGDIWTTTSGLFARINGGTQQYAPLGSTNTFTGTNTFSGATVSFGTSTAASTINIGTGATLTATTKAVNIGTAGVSGSTTNIAIGSAVAGATTSTTISGNITATGLTLDLGNNTATSATYTLGGGATISGATKTINIGSGGVAGSTTSINIGSTTGTSNVNFNVTTGTVSLGGNATATTQAADTNSTAVASTAYVVGQAGSATPLINGTAAVGTSLRYARQDHVHPTDTTRAPLASPTFTGTVTIPAGASISGFAPLASPTFTGTPAAPTAAVDTNTTQLATTAYVVGQGYLKSATASSTYAPLASPALTGTPTAPTATAGTNTTQIATTAFVTAAIPAYATEAQALAGTSSTTVLNPLQVRNLLANAGYTAYSSLIGNYSSYQSGTAGLAIYSDFFSPYVSTLNGKIALCPSSSATINSFQSRGKGEVVLDWTKPIWFSFRMHYPTGGTGDATTVCRVTLGKTASTFGDLSTAGFGVKWTGGTSGAFTLMAHNGTTLTTSASAVTVSNTTYFPTTTSAADFLVYSDGAGNITLYCNGTSVATATGGPSSGTVTSPRFAFETDNATTYTTLCAPSYMGVRSFFGY